MALSFFLPQRSILFYSWCSSFSYWPKAKTRNSTNLNEEWNKRKQIKKHTGTTTNTFHDEVKTTKEQVLRVQNDTWAYLSVAQQVAGGPRVQQGCQYLLQRDLELFFKGQSPLRRVPLCAVHTRVGYTLRQIRQNLIHLIWWDKNLLWQGALRVEEG